METNKKTFGTSTKKATLATSLRSNVRTNFNNHNSNSFSFVADKVLQLIKTPAVKPEIKSFALADSDSLDVFQHNSSCIAIANKLFAYNMVPLSPETSLPARNLLDRLQSLRSNSIGIYHKLGGQIKQFSCFVITQVMKLVSVADARIKTLFSNIRNCFGILLHGFKKQFVDWNLYFDSSNGFHVNNTDGLLYKSCTGMSSGIGGWQFPPQMNLWVYLPYDL